MCNILPGGGFSRIDCPGCLEPGGVRMGAGRFVGRVGGLAVALGVGAATSFGCASAWADDAAGAETRSSADSGSSSGSPTSPGGLESRPSPQAPDSDSDAADGEGGGGDGESSSADGDGDSAGSSDEADDSDPAEDSDGEPGDDPDGSARDYAADADDEFTGEVSEDFGNDAEPSASSTAPTAVMRDESSARTAGVADDAVPADVMQDWAATDLDGAEEVVAPTLTADPEAPALDEAPADEAPVAESQALAVDPDAVGELPFIAADTAKTVAAAESAAEPTTATDDLAAAVAASLLGASAPGDVPVDSPAEWVLLAAARRELTESADDNSTVASLLSTGQTVDTSGSTAAQGSTLDLATPSTAAADPVQTFITEAIKTAGVVINVAATVLRDTIVNTLTFIGEAIKAASVFTKFVVDTAVGVLRSATVTAADVITGAVTLAVDTVAGILDANPSPFGDAVANTLKFLGQTVNGAVDAISQAVTDTLTFTGAALDTGLTFLTDAVTATAGLLSAAIYNALTAIAGFFSPNAAPIGVDDELSTAEDTALVITAAALLANDTDPDDDPLTIVGVGTPGHGTLTDNTDGTYAYTPATDYTGTDTFTYTLTDGTDITAATVTITVTAANHVPLISAPTTVSAPAPADGTVTGQVHVSDVDGDALTYTTSAPGVSVDPDTGAFTFIPEYAARHAAIADAATSQEQTYHFTVTATDVHGASVDITVDASLVAPVTADANVLAIDIDSSRRPNLVTVAPDGTTAYVVVDNWFTYSGALVYVETATNTITNTIYLPAGTTPAMAMSPDGRYLYLPSYRVKASTDDNGVATGDIVAYGPPGTEPKDYSVSVLDLQSGTEYHSIPFSTAVASVALSPDGDHLYALTGGAQTSSVTVIDTRDFGIVTTILVDGSANSLEMSTAGDNLFVFDRYAGDTLTVVDTGSNTVVKTVSLEGITGLATSPDGGHLYVSQPLYDTASESYTSEVLDLDVGNDFAELHRYAIDGYPGDIATSSSGDFLYVASSGALAVIDTSTGAVESVPTGSWSQQIAVSPSGGRVYLTNPYDGTLSVVAGLAANAEPSVVLSPVGGGDGTTAEYRLFMTDDDGDQLTYAVTDHPRYGTLADDGAGGFTYTPQYQSDVFSAIADSFTVTVIDGHGGAVSRTIDLTIEPAAVGVTAAGDSAEIAGFSADGTQAYLIGRIHADGAHSNSALTDTSLYTVNTVTGAIESVAPLPLHSALIGLSADRSTVYLTSYVDDTGQFIEYDVATGQLSDPVDLGTAVDFVLSPDGAHLYFLADGQDRIGRVDLTTRAVDYIALPAFDNGGSYSVSADGRYLYVPVALGSDFRNGVLVVFDALTGDEVERISDVGADSIESVTTAPDGSVLYLGVVDWVTDTYPGGSTTYTVASTIVYDLPNHAAIETIPGWRQVRISPDGGTAYLVGEGDYTVFDTATRSVVGTFPAWGVWYGALAFTSDGQFAFLHGYDSRSVSIIDRQSQGVVSTFSDHRIDGYGDTVTSFEISPDGSRLVYTFDDGTVTLLDTLKLIRPRVTNNS